MTTVIANATIVTGNAGRDVLHDAAIAIAEDRIAAIGQADDVRPAYPDAEVVDGRGKAVFPRPYQLPHAPAGHGRPGNTGGLRLSDAADLSGVGPRAADR